MKYIIVSLLVGMSMVMPMNKAIAEERKTVDTKQTEIDRKVAEFAEHQQKMAAFQKLSLEHSKKIQKSYMLFQEKLKQAQTPEEKYRLQLEFEALQNESKAEFQEKLMALQKKSAEKAKD